MPRRLVVLSSRRQKPPARAARPRLTLSRRHFLRACTLAGIAALSASLGRAAASTGGTRQKPGRIALKGARCYATPCYAGPYTTGPAATGQADQRARAAYDLRAGQAAAITLWQPVPEHPCNGDQEALFDYIGCYTKGLQHLPAGQHGSGEVVPAAYEALLAAISGGRLTDYETLADPAILGCFPTGPNGDAGGEGGEIDRFNPQASAANRQMRQVNPVAAIAYDLEGIDSHQATQLRFDPTAGPYPQRVPFPPAPGFSSAEEVAEIAEDYWMALARDVAFGEYGTGLGTDRDPTTGGSLTAAAAADLSRFRDYRGPTVGGRVTPGTLFRGFPAGCLQGPYVSQFLLRAIPYGALAIDPRLCAALPLRQGGRDYLTTFQEWLDIQNGCQPQQVESYGPSLYPRSGRDLGQYVHVDVLFQAYLDAALLLEAPCNDRQLQDPAFVPPCGRFMALEDGTRIGGGFGARDDPGNPYTLSRVQAGFATLGAINLETLVCEVTTRALKAVWFQKWSVHRRLRPEAFAGFIHKDMLFRQDPAIPDSREYPVDTETNGQEYALLRQGVLPRVYAHNAALNGGPGTYLLPQAFPEGSPLHPAYGAGHATVGGACVTILKAWFQADSTLADLGVIPVEPTPDGTALRRWPGDPATLTIRGELDKLAANLALARNFAGVHWRSDYAESARLGEAVALWLLCDQRATYPESYGFSLTTFEGVPIRIEKDSPTCFVAPA